MPGGTHLGQIKTISKLRSGRVVDGVCAGFAEYVGIDVMWVRIGWAALSLAGGIGILAYAAGMLLFPRREGEVKDELAALRVPSMLLTGILLVVIGVLVSLRIFGAVSYDFWRAWHIAWVVLWPLSLIGGGLVVLFFYWRESTHERPGPRRPVAGRKILGVCSALGEYFNLDANLARFVLLLVIVLSRGVGLIVYVIMGLVLPEAKDEAEGA